MTGKRSVVLLLMILRTGMCRTPKHRGGRLPCCQRRTAYKCIRCLFIGKLNRFDYCNARYSLVTSLPFIIRHGSSPTDHVTSAPAPDCNMRLSNEECRYWKFRSASRLTVPRTRTPLLSLTFIAALYCRDPHKRNTTAIQEKNSCIAVLL